MIDPPRVVGAAAVVYRLFDVGYQIRLEHALDLLATNTPERVRPVRGEAQAIQIPNPPITVILGSERIRLDGIVRDVEVSARIFDFGVLSLRARIPVPDRLTWTEFSDFGAAVNAASDLQALFEQHRRLLADRIQPAIDRPQRASVTEDYIVYRIRAIVGEQGTPLGDEAVRELDLVPLLLNETRPLSPDARRELLPHRFSYYTDDLAILTWDNALILDSEPSDTDVQFMLEFANAQLLELRYYDALLDAELPRMYDRIEVARARPRILMRRGYAELLAELQTLVADSTELVERVENSLKVTDDVYLARIYTTALEIFRGRVWRSGIDRKLSIIRETYGMLNDESQAGRAELLETAIVVLIVLEIILAFFR